MFLSRRAIALEIVTLLTKKLYQTRVTYSQERQSKIDIYMVKHLPELSNREVTFFLGFSWKGPAALGVKDLMTEDEDDSLSPRSIEIDQTADMSDVRDTSFSYNTIEKPSARPKKIQQKIVRAKTVPAGPVMVTDEAYSKTVIERILYDPPDQVVFSCVCQEGSYFRSILLHISPDETYVYSLHKDNQTLLTKGDLIRLFMDKKLHKVFFDIGAISEILIQKYGVLMEGNIWDVKVLIEYLSEQDEDSEDLRKHYRDAKARFDIWSQESSSFCVKLSKEDMDKTVLQSLVTRGNHMSKIFGICKSKLDQSLRSSQMSEVRKKIFAIAQPPHLADKIKQIKEQEKQQTQKQKKKEKTPQPSQPQQAKADSKKKQKKKKRP